MQSDIANTAGGGLTSGSPSAQCQVRMRLKYKALLIAIAIPTLVALRYSWSMFFMNVADNPVLVGLPFEASLAALVICINGLYRPGRLQPTVLIIVIPVLILYAFVSLLIELQLPHQLPPSDEFLRHHVLRLGLILGSISIYLACFYPLVRMRRWLSSQVSAERHVSGEASNG